MFGFSAMMMICLLEVVFSSYGVTALRMEGDGFPGNDPSSVITSFEAFILCVPSGLLSYLELLFPFLCALPFSFSILTDKAANTDTLLCAYCGKRRYIISKITAAFIGSFLIFFVPLMINGCLNYLIFDNSMGANLFNPNWRFNGFGVMRATDYPNAPFGELLAFWGSASSGSFLLFSCIPQMLNPFSTFSPSVKSKEVALSDRGGRSEEHSLNSSHAT